MHESLVEIKPPEFAVELDIRYATANNFTGAAIYKRAGCYLHREAAKKLQEAVRLAAAVGCRIKIFDTYRPVEAQQALFDHTPDPEFISQPGVGSTPHCRGVAVDLTLTDEAGNDLEMGTEFDAFTPLSHHANTEISRKAQQNRFVLMGIMAAAGWDFYRNEWWHYQLFNPREYPLLTDREAGTGLV